MNFLIISAALLASLLGESHGQWGYQSSHWPTNIQTRFTGVNNLIPMTQYKPVSNVHQVPCFDANSLTPTTAAPVYYDPCTEKSAEQTSQVALQNSHKVFNQGNSNGYMFFFRNPSTVKTVHQEKTITVPKLPDPCVDESVETQASTVNIQNPKVTFTKDDLNLMGSILNNLYGSIMNPSTEQPKPTTVAPAVVVPCEDETHKTQETTQTKETSKLTFTEDDISLIGSFLNLYGSVMNSATQPPTTTTVAPEVVVPCEDETHKTQETTETKETSKLTLTQDDLKLLFDATNSIGSLYNSPTDKPKPTTAAPEVLVPCEDETHKTQETSGVNSDKFDMNKLIDALNLLGSIYQPSNEQQKPATNKNTETNVVKTTTTTIAAAPTTKTTQSNEITAVTTDLSGILKNSQPTGSFKIKPTTTTTYTTTTNQYTPTKVIEGVVKEGATSHVQNSADCDETKTASGGAASVDVTSTYAFPIPQTKDTESHEGKTVKSVPTSVSTSTWGQYPVVSPAVPHIINWHKEQQSGSTYQKNSETHNFIFGAGAQQPQLTASQTTYPAASINFEFSGQGNGVDQSKSNGVNTHQLINLSDGSAVPIATLLEILKKQRDC